MKNRTAIWLSILFFSAFSSSAVNANFTGDTQGKIDRIAIQPVSGGVHSMLVYFSNNENDRYACIANQGYMYVSTANPAVNLDHFNMMLSLAMAAQISGRSFAIDSPQSDPCNSGNMAWLLGP